MYADTPAAPKPAPPIQSNIIGAKDALGTLHSLLTDLEARLQPVLGPANQASVDTANETQTARRDTVDFQIQDIANITKEAAKRIEGLMNRLLV